MLLEVLPDLLVSLLCVVPLLLVYHDFQIYFVTSEGGGYLACNKTFSLIKVAK